MQYQGIEEQRIVNTGSLPIARDLDMPLVCTNDVHYLRQTDQHPHDILLCIGTGKSVSDEKRLKYHGDQFFLKTAEEMAQVFGDYPERCRTRAHRRALQRHAAEGQAHLPNFAVPPGYTSTYFEHVVAQGFAVRLQRWKAAGAGELRARSPTMKTGSRTKSTSSSG
jgi:DNA polymerase-3 subunit alpha